MRNASVLHQPLYVEWENLWNMEEKCILKASKLCHRIIQRPTSTLTAQPGGQGNSVFQTGHTLLLSDILLFLVQVSDENGEASHPAEGS